METLDLMELSEITDIDLLDWEIGYLEGRYNWVYGEKWAIVIEISRIINDQVNRSINNLWLQQKWIKEDFYIFENLKTIVDRIVKSEKWRGKISIFSD